MSGAVDLHENLVEVPLVAGSGSAPTQLVGVVAPELGTPGPDRLVGDHHTAGKQQLLDVAQTQRSGGPGESHPRAPTDPYVNLSVHTALVILITRRLGRRWSRPSARRTAGTRR